MCAPNTGVNAVWFGVHVGGILLADPFGALHWFTVDNVVVAGEAGAGEPRCLAKFVSPARNKLTCLCEIVTDASSALHSADDAAGSERRDGTLLVVGDSRGNILAFPCVLPSASIEFSTPWTGFCFSAYGIEEAKDVPPVAKVRLLCFRGWRHGATIGGDNALLRMYVVAYVAAICRS